jgi:hypothetical protein
MTTSNLQLTYTVAAAEDLSAQSARFKVITLAGTLMNTVGTGSGRVAGINITSARSGETAAYVWNGITKAVAGVAISTLGYPIRTASGGFITPAASGDGHYGRALETCASGDLVQVFVDFTSFPAWNGL